MKFSYKWLGEHIDGALPPAQKIAEGLTTRAFEVEDLVENESDVIFDVKVTPNRAADCLSHRGLARELAAIFGLKAKEKKGREFSGGPGVVSVEVKDGFLCPLYLTSRVSGIKNRESPLWLKERIRSIGERPINLFVDIGNFVMFDIGQPIHVFDARKVAGGRIIVRVSERGETITTLDGKKVVLRGGELVIADSEKILGIAGIKGGRAAEVTLQTEDVIIEAASFSPRSIRRSSEKLGIKTEASRRFENGLSSHFAREGVLSVLGLLSEEAGGSRFSASEIVKVGNFPPPPKPIAVSMLDVESRLGVPIKETFFSETLKKLRFGVVKEKGKLIVTPSADRLDIDKKEDIVEEIGRFYGYENLPSLTPSRPARLGLPHKRFFYGNRIRKILSKLGFSEVYTYTFVKDGEVFLENPIADDKSALRPNLLPGVREALARNAYYAPLLELSLVKIFELGRVFSKDGEYLSLAFGVTGIDKNTNKEAAAALTQAVTRLSSEFVNFSSMAKIFPNAVEVNADSLFENLPDPDGYETLFDFGNVDYEQLSIYPFVLRDVSIFVPKGTGAGEVSAVIKESAGSLLVRQTLFDEFKKEFPDGHTVLSYTFSLVFQSFEKTLTDEEVGKCMEKITKSLEKNKDWRVR